MRWGISRGARCRGGLGEGREVSYLSCLVKGLGEGGRHTIEMQHPHGSSVGLLESPQGGKSQAVVSAEGDQLWLLEELGEGTSLAELLEGGGHLREG